MERMISAALHRLGVVRTLQHLWRRDVRNVVEKAVSSGGRNVETITNNVRMHGERIKETQESVTELRRQLQVVTENCEQLHRHVRGLEHVVVRNRLEIDMLRAFDQSIATGTLANHVANAIAQAPLLTDPAPMLMIDNIFPADIYGIMVASIPAVEAFTVKDRYKADYRVRKSQVAVSDLTARVWPYLDNELIPQTLVPALTARFAPNVLEYYVALLGSADLAERVASMRLEATDGRLMLRRPGYHLEPHMDPKRVLFTTLLYFARPGDSPTHGTAFYRVDGHVVRNHATTYYPQQDGHRCELVREVPFRANTAAAFLNSAAHGADIPATARKGLERYAMQFYVGPPVEELQKALRSLPEECHGAWAELLKG